jgi:hypothetical protein
MKYLLKKCILRTKSELQLESKGMKNYRIYEPQRHNAADAAHK